MIDELTELVRTSDQYQKAEAARRLIKIPTGDGMALVFYTVQKRQRNVPSKSAAFSKNIHDYNFGWAYTAVR